MFLSTVAKYIKLTWAFKKMGILSALEYRVSFLFNVLGMLFNDAILILVWVIFFSKFPNINGWTLQDSFLLISISWLGYVFVTMIAGGVFELSKMIVQADLDYYITAPHNIIWHISVSKTPLEEIGTGILCVILYILACNSSIPGILLFLILSCISGIITFNFVLITQSLAFFIGNAEQISHVLVRSLLYMVYIPQPVFSIPLKIITTTIVPIFFICVLPARILKEFNIADFSLLILFTVISSYLAVYIFNKGLSKYESGNLINIRS